MSDIRSITRRLDLAAGGLVLVQYDDWHPGQYRLTVGTGGATQTVLLDGPEAQQVANLLIGVLFTVHGRPI